VVHTSVHNQILATNEMFGEQKERPIQSRIPLPPSVPPFASIRLGTPLLFFYNSTTARQSSPPGSVDVLAVASLTPTVSVQITTATAAAAPQWCRNIIASSARSILRCHCTSARHVLHVLLYLTWLDATGRTRADVLAHTRSPVYSVCRLLLGFISM